MLQPTSLPGGAAPIAPLCAPSAGRSKDGAAFLWPLTVAYLAALIAIGAGVFWATRAPLDYPSHAVGNGLREIPAECFDAVDGREFYDCIAGPLK